MPSEDAGLIAGHGGRIIYDEGEMQETPLCVLRCRCMLKNISCKIESGVPHNSVPHNNILILTSKTPELFFSLIIIIVGVSCPKTTI